MNEKVGIINGLQYSVTDGQITITKISEVDDSGVMIVPNEIEGIPVKKLILEYETDFWGKRSYYKGEIREVHIPSNVEYIEALPALTEKICVDNSNPYYWSDGVGLYNGDCTTLLTICVNNVKQYDVKAGVLEIGENAFEKVKDNIEEIILPDSLERISEKAFYRCQHIREINIPRNVSFIADDAIYRGARIVRFHSHYDYLDPSALERVNVDPDNMHFKDDDGVLYSKDGKELLIYPTSKKGPDYVVLSTTEKIRKKAFLANQYLEKIVLPTSVKEIEEDRTAIASGTGCFEGCAQLKEVEVVADKIPFRAFMNCALLQKISLSENIKEIEDEAFYNTAINDVTLPKHIVFVGCRVFGNDHFERIVVFDEIKSTDTGRMVSANRKDYEIIIKDSNTNDIKGKVFMCEYGEPERIGDMLCHSWKEHAEFDYSKMDSLFKEYKDIMHRAQTARYRLEYPIDLSEDNKKMYIDFLSRNGVKILTQLLKEKRRDDIIALVKLGALKKSNIDKYIAVVEKSKNNKKLLDWLNEYKKAL